MNPLRFIQTKFLHDEKVMKNVIKPTFKNKTGYNDQTQLEFRKK